jgi:putative tryptophan/tyrosine transport system substrate-binding protein
VAVRSTTRRLQGLALGALASCGVLLAGAPAEAAEVALVKSGPAPAWQPAFDALRAAAVGHTITEYNLANSRAEAERTLPALAGRTAAVVAFGPLAAQAVRERLPDVPLVYCMVADPSEIGLQGASNTTGVAFFAPMRNQLVAFRAVNPAAKRIGIVVSTDAGRRYAEEAKRSGGALGLEVVVLAVTSMSQVPQAMREMVGGGHAVDAVWMLPDALIADSATRRFIFSTALEAHKPVYGFSAALVAEGALVSHAPDLASVGQGAGELVSRILAGQKPERLPPVVPRGEVVINRNVAAALRLVVPPQVLQAARLF